MWGWLYVQDWGLGDDVTEGSSECWAVGSVGLTFDDGGCGWGGEDVWVGCGLYELALDLLVGFALKKERNLLSKTSLHNFKWHFDSFEMKFMAYLTTINSFCDFYTSTSSSVKEATCSPYMS